MAERVRPMPIPSSMTEQYWRSAQKGEFVIQYCDDCQRFLHPPVPQCRLCGGVALGWRKVSGRGTIVTCVVVRSALVNGFQDLVPYVGVEVELDEQPGLRVLTNLLGCDAETDHIGERVRVQFEDAGNEVVLPQFVLDLPTTV